MSVNTPIPQMINISNTLSANTIQQIRSDLLKWQALINKQPNPKSVMLTVTDYEKILSYLNSLVYAKRQFMLDNLLINDPQDSNYKLVTDADRNLYVGLLNMYKDYIVELEQLKIAFNYQNNIQQQQESSVPIHSSQTDTQQKQSKPSERIIDHIINVLPTELAKVRKEFIDELIKDNELRKSLKPSNDLDPNDDKLLLGVIKLCNLDINNKDNIVTYLKFLKLLGYSKDLLKERLPAALTKPKPKQKVKQPQSSISVTKSIKSLSSSSSSSSSSTTTAIKTKQTKRKVSKPDVYIADSSNKKVGGANNNSNNGNSTTIPSDLKRESKNNDSSSSFSANTTVIDNSTEKDVANINKKKISFSKYLQKDDNEKEPLEPLKRSIDDNTNQEDNLNTKKRKLTTSFTPLDVTLDGVATPPDTIESTTSTLNPTSEIKITSILKSPSVSDNSGSQERRRKNKSIKLRFMEDKDLVRVYGDDLPEEGLKVTPSDLKKILRPFIEGEPGEKLYLETVDTSLSSMGKSIHVVPLNLNNIKSGIENNDIVETRGGPIKCETKVPQMYRDGFHNFSKDLKKIQPREPIITNEDIEMLNNPELNKPIIARAFGKNKLLLRNDRGGLPYKPVPAVTKNYYPIRYTSSRK